MSKRCRNSQTSVEKGKESPIPKKKRDLKNVSKLSGSKSPVDQAQADKTLNRIGSRVSQKLIEEVGQIMGNEEDAAYNPSIFTKSQQFDGNPFKSNRLINLYLQLPEEVETEVVKGFEGEFVALHDQNYSHQGVQPSFGQAGDNQRTLKPAFQGEFNRGRESLNDQQLNLKLAAKKCSVEEQKNGGVKKNMEEGVPNKLFQSDNNLVKNGKENGLSPDSKKATVQIEEESILDQRPTMRLRLNDIISFLKKQGYQLDNTFVSYYSTVFSAYINCNLEPISKKVWLTEDDLEMFDDVLSLRLKFQKAISRKQATEGDDQSDDDEEDDSRNFTNSHHKDDQNKRASNRLRARQNTTVKDKGSESESEDKQIRGQPGAPKTKERTVGYVIEKVAQWRRLYNGTYDQNFNHQRMSLEAAAKEVGVSKKSLDDYLAQLRAGRQYGYDFNAKKDEKVGDLRRFVKVKQSEDDGQSSRRPQ